MKTVYVDANPHQICYKVKDEPPRIKEIETATNNEAEYMAVIWALESIPDDVNIVSDSQLIINQLRCEWSIKEKRLQALAHQAFKLCDGRKVTFEWTPRERNPAGKVLG
jgi:ribonuclease HI